MVLGAHLSWVFIENHMGQSQVCCHLVKSHRPIYLQSVQISTGCWLAGYHGCGRYVVIDLSQFWNRWYQIPRSRWTSHSFLFQSQSPDYGSSGRSQDCCTLYCQEGNTWSWARRKLHLKWNNDISRNHTFENPQSDLGSKAKSLF